MTPIIPSRAGGWMALAAAGVLATLPFPIEGRAPSPAEDCALCHGELEFLRQHAPDLESARRLRVTEEEVQGSAHSGSACDDCHAGFQRWPHPAASVSRTCGSCHEEAHGVWSASVHGPREGVAIEEVECSACHTTHRVATVEALGEEAALQEMNGRCVSCHETSEIPAGDPHFGTVSCASCHPPHGVTDVDESDASVAPGEQRETCGACHEEEAEAWGADAHGSALAEGGPVGLARLELLGHEAAPACTSCHGSHGMAWTGGAITMDQAAVCGECHEHAMETFDDSYHGQATALGSVAVATCSDCHGTHGIFGEDDPRSMVHPDRLVESCGVCHEASRPAFVLYQPHADHNDRENYPYVYWSYRLMTALLVGVFSVFGLHSALWIVRLTMDTLRGSSGEHK